MHAAFQIPFSLSFSLAGNTRFYLMVRRGNYAGGAICYFATKLENAYNAGAAGVIIVDNQPTMGRPTLYMVAPEGYVSSPHACMCTMGHIAHHHMHACV
jgi:hypothetical protein